MRRATLVQGHIFPATFFLLVPCLDPTRTVLKGTSHTHTHIELFVKPEPKDSICHLFGTLWAQDKIFLTVLVEKCV